MGNLQNNQDIESRISLYFDNALADSERKELLTQIDSNPRVCKIFNKEKSYREFIKNNITRPSVSTDFIQSIKDKIRIV